MPQSTIARAVLVFSIGLAVMVTGTLAWQWSRTSQQGVATSGGTTATGTALIGGPFELLDQNGELRRESDFAGRHMLIYFGFTYCPDICPSSLSLMTQALDILEERAPEKAGTIAPIFITVDPERDTVEAMKSYAAHFHPDMVALTGSEEQVAKAAKAYRVYYAKVEDEAAGDYLMDHSSFIYLMGPDGGYVSHFAHNATPDSIAEGLERYVGS